MTTWPKPKQAPTHLGAIDYHDVGEGPVLVFLHLILAAADHWDTMPPLLADRYRCIVPTLPMGGHRLPADDDAALDPDGLARCVVDLLDHLGVDDVTLIGNDSGGAISQVIAADYPERLGRVVLTNCDMYDTFPPRVFAYFKVLPYVPGSIWVMARILPIRMFWPLPIVFGHLANEMDGTKVDRWAAAMKANKKVRRDLAKVIKGLKPHVTNAAAAKLRSTTLPFLLAWGADDKAFRPSLAERFVDEVPTAELVMIENCKTFVCWDQPERLAELIDGFVS